MKNLVNNEYVMATISSVNGSFTINRSFPDGGYFEYNDNTLKYLTAYAFGTTSNDQKAYNRGRLGDATSEIILSNNNAWYSNNNIYFPYSSQIYMKRSSYNMFSIDYNVGNEDTYASTRAVLTVTD